MDIGAEHGLSQHQVRLLQAAQLESKRNKAKIEGRDRDAAAAELARDDTLRGTGFSAKDVANAAELTGTGMRLDLVAVFNDGSRWVYEIKSLAFCPSNYGTRWKNKAKAWGAGADAQWTKPQITTPGLGRGRGDLPAGEEAPGGRRAARSHAHEKSQRKDSVRQGWPTHR